LPVTDSAGQVGTPWCPAVTDVRHAGRSDDAAGWIKWNRHGADVRNELGEGFRASLGL